MVLFQEIEQLFVDTGIMLSLYEAVVNEEKAIDVVDAAIRKACHD
jgi:hypothetical protein